MLIRTWIEQKFWFLIVEVNIFYDFETFSTVILVIWNLLSNFLLKVQGWCG